MAVLGLIGLIVGIVVYLVGTIYVMEKLEDVGKAWGINLSILIPTFFFVDVAFDIYLLKYFFG